MISIASESVIFFFLQSNRVGQTQLILRLSSLGQSLLPHLPSLQSAPQSMPILPAATLAPPIATNATPAAPISSSHPTQATVAITAPPAAATAAAAAVPTVFLPSPFTVDAPPPLVGHAVRLAPQTLPPVVVAAVGIAGADPSSSMYSAQSAPVAPVLVTPHLGAFENVHAVAAPPAVPLSWGTRVTLIFEF
jgi:hypothetical protein